MRRWAAVAGVVAGSWPATQTPRSQLENGIRDRHEVSSRTDRLPARRRSFEQTLLFATAQRREAGLEFRALLRDLERDLEGFWQRSQPLLVDPCSSRPVEADHEERRVSFRSCRNLQCDGRMTADSCVHVAGQRRSSRRVTLDEASSVCVRPFQREVIRQLQGGPDARHQRRRFRLEEVDVEPLVGPLPLSMDKVSPSPQTDLR